MYRNIIGYVMPAFILLQACNLSAPPNTDGLAQDTIFSDTLTTYDSATAITDTIVKIDSLLIRTDSAKEDNTLNKDTAVLAPSLGIDVKGKTPQEIMAFAESLKGVPYVYGATNPSVGFDCSGFITYVFNHFGIKVPRSSIDFTNVGKTVPVEQAKRGDIILFTGTNPMERHVGHMGLIVSNTDTLRFIHSSSGKAMGVTVSPLSNRYITRYVKTIRIFPQNGI